MLAGSGVGHFDRGFIRRYMPRLESMLAYPCLDVGVVRRFIRLAGGCEYPAPAGGKAHRALPDIEHHLAEARHYVKMLSGKAPLEVLASGPAWMSAGWVDQLEGLARDESRAGSHDAPEVAGCDETQHVYRRGRCGCGRG